MRGEKPGEMPGDRMPLHVSLVATPDAQVSPLSGFYEVLNAFELLARFEPEAVPKQPPFTVEIIAPGAVPDTGASGLPLGVHRTHHEVERTDIVILPLMMVDGAEWATGRYPELVDWLRAMHRVGAVLCAACTGALLLAETGLLDGREATIHRAFAPTFRDRFPKVRLRPEEILVTTGERREFVMSGASTSWHDLALYLIARYVSPAAAQAMARFMLLQWPSEGQAPDLAFAPPMNHDDAVVLTLQQWLKAHFMVASPVEEMLRRSGLPRRSFERRFARATGLSPIAYVQNLRVEEAKRRLERTSRPVEEISCDVGYENPAFFRRLFKRSTRLTPGGYRRKFQMPDFPPSD